MKPVRNVSVQHDRERAWRALEDAEDAAYHAANPGAQFDYVYGVLAVVDICETIPNVSLARRPAPPDRMP